MTINNRCLSSDGQNAAWGLDIAGEAPAQHASMEFTIQMLFRSPMKPGNRAKMGLQLEFQSTTFDDDENGTDYADRTKAFMIPQLGTTKLESYGDRGICCVLAPQIVPLTTPAIPD